MVSSLLQDGVEVRATWRIRWEERMVAICRLKEPELAAMTHSCKTRSSSHRQGQQMGLFEKAQGGMYRALLDILDLGDSATERMSVEHSSPGRVNQLGRYVSQWRLLLTRDDKCGDLGQSFVFLRCQDFRCPWTHQSTETYPICISCHLLFSAAAGRIGTVTTSLVNKGRHYLLLS